MTTESSARGERVDSAAERQRTAIQTGHLDLAVSEVFQLMMGVPCDPAPIAPAGFTGANIGVTAIVGLAGSLSGACVMRMQEPVALRLAEFMVGAPMTSFDRTVKDALGEACNMLAGTWKGRQEEYAASCMLSIPAVISGLNYEFHLPRPAFHLLRAYLFDGHGFSFAIDCAGL